MAQFICVSNLTDVRSEASNWMVSANKSDGKTEKRIQRIIIIFFRIKFAIELFEALSLMLLY